MDWELPVIALRSQVVLPRTLENVDVGRPKSKRALEEAQGGDNRVLLVVQREPRNDDPTGEDLFSIGTLCVVKQVIRLPDDTLQVLVEGRERALINDYLPGPSLRARVSTIAETGAERDDADVQALIDQTKSAFSDYAQQNKNLRLDSFHLENLRGLKEPGPLADVITKYATWEVGDKQRILEEPNVATRLELVFSFLSRDLDRFDTEKQISARVKQQMDSNQREYYLREQMKAIQKRTRSATRPTRSRRCKHQDRREEPARKHAEERALKEVDRLEKMPGGSPGSDRGADLPRHDPRASPGRRWTRSASDVSAHRSAILDEDHYALEGTEGAHPRIPGGTATDEGRRGQRTTRRRSSASSARPGSGRRAWASRSPAAWTAKFVRMSLGGVRDEGRDPRAPPDLHRFDARSHHPGHEDRGHDQPRSSCSTRSTR